MYKIYLDYLSNRIVVWLLLNVHSLNGNITRCNNFLNKVYVSVAILFTVLLGTYFAHKAGYMNYSLFSPNLFVLFAFMYRMMDELLSVVDHIKSNKLHILIA